MKRPASTSQPKHTNIGVVGLGIIGSRIAAHLRREGFSIYVWNRSPRPVPNFVGSLGDLAELCDYIQIFVSDDDALLQTAEQLSEKLTQRHVVLAHSTVAPDSMRAAADIVQRRGAQFVEACFTGSKGAAEKGELVYYVGGTDEALREGRPILEASSKEIVHIGAVGQASVIKVATNMVSAASVQAAAEALALVQAQGLPVEKFVEAPDRCSMKPVIRDRRNFTNLRFCPCNLNCARPFHDSSMSSSLLCNSVRKESMSMPRSSFTNVYIVYRIELAPNFRKLIERRTTKVSM